jgi:hypothetical protein
MNGDIFHLLRLTGRVKYVSCYTEIKYPSIYVTVYIFYTQLNPSMTILYNINTYTYLILFFLYLIYWFPHAYPIYGQGPM